MPCTVLVAARSGTRPPLLSHSMDTAGVFDGRLVRVPPNTNPPSPRPVYSWDERALPRFFGVGRGPIPAYDPDSTYYWPHKHTASSEPIGYIPQTDKDETFGYWECVSMGLE